MAGIMWSKTEPIRPAIIYTWMALVHFERREEGRTLMNLNIKTEGAGLGVFDVETECKKYLWLE